MKAKILIVGGYGSVGRVISTALGERFPGQVIAAGRNVQKVTALSLETQQKVLPLQLDIFSTEEDLDQHLEFINGLGGEFRFTDEGGLRPNHPLPVEETKKEL